MSRVNKVIMLMLAFVTMIGLSACQNFVQNDPVTCRVVDKDRSTEVVEGNSKSVFRIYTEGCGEENTTLGIADNWVAGNFNSSDVYAKIQPGKTYIFDTVGTRNGYMSWFKEITHVQEAPVP